MATSCIHIHSPSQRSVSVSRTAGWTAGLWLRALPSPGWEVGPGVKGDRRASPGAREQHSSSRASLQIATKVPSCPSSASPTALSSESRRPAGLLLTRRSASRRRRTGGETKERKETRLLPLLKCYLRAHRLLLFSTSISGVDENRLGRAYANG